MGTLKSNRKARRSLKNFNQRLEGKLSIIENEFINDLFGEDDGSSYKDIFNYYNNEFRRVAENHNRLNSQDLIIADVDFFERTFKPEAKAEKLGLVRIVSFFGIILTLVVAKLISVWIVA